MMRQHVYKHQGFQQVVNHYYDGLMQRNPIAASWLGEHHYDGLLPEVGAEAIEKDIAYLRQARDLFQALGERELSLDERLDRQVVLFNLQKDLFMLEDVKQWRLGRDLAMDIGDSLFVLFVRDFAPLYERVESIISRVKAAPMYLNAGRTLFQAVPQVWGEIFIDSAERLPQLLDFINDGLKGRVNELLYNRYVTASRDLKMAVESHIRWFKSAIMTKAHGDWAMGQAPFQALLSVRRLGLSTGEILDLGDHYLRKAKAKVDALARKMTGGNFTREAIKKVRAKTPRNFDQVLDTYRDAVARSRAFVELNGFATLPEAETLQILETPAYLAHLIPFAAYLPPERYARPQKGIYLVTRPGPGGDLSRHCYADISNTSVHEGYPGHHLQLSSQNLHESRIRPLCDSVELLEGWAHYCEEETKVCGFEVSDENLLIQALDEVWRASRVSIDVNIHQKSWTFDQGLEYLVSNTGMGKEEAMAEMRRYTQTPGYQLSYLVGKHLLCQVKDDLRKTFGADFKARMFHDLVIREGGIPLALGREYYPEMMKEILAKGLSAAD